MKFQMTEARVYLELAELFFLDQEHDQDRFEAVARAIKELNWTREQTKDLLVQHFSPVCGQNLGYLLYPVIGEWQGFNEATLFARIQQSQRERTQKLGIWLKISDWWSLRILEQLGLDRLLSLL